MYRRSFLFSIVALVTCCGCDVTKPVLSPASLAEKAIPSVPAASSDWIVADPQVNKMDGAVTRIIKTRGPAQLVLCFENGKPCSVPVAVHVPSGCTVESNVENLEWSRRLRVRFDDEKARTEIWSIVDDREAVFPHNSAAFIAELKKHKTFMIELGCNPSDSYVLTVGIQGLQSALDLSH